MKEGKKQGRRSKDLNIASEAENLGIIQDTIIQRSSREKCLLDAQNAWLAKADILPHPTPEPSDLLRQHSNSTF